MRGGSSIKRRLALRLGGLFCIVFLALLAYMTVRFHNRPQESAVERLRDHMDEICGALAAGPDGSLHFARPAATYDYVVRDGSAAVLFASSPAAAERLDAPPPGFEETFIARRQGATGLVLAATRCRGIAGLPVVQVGETLSRRAWVWDGLVDELRLEFLPVLLPLLAATLAVGWLTVTHSLRPLDELARRAGEITPSSTGLRLPERRLPAELRPLVAAVNTALDRLDRGFRAQREFTADAAHELRTPLAVLAAHVDALGDAAAAASLRDDVRRMGRLVEQLLALARLEALDLAAADPVDLGAVCAEVAASLAPLAVRRGRAIEVAAPERPVLARGSADALHRAVRNLAENAVEHAPAGTAVLIRVLDTPAVEVIDRGPGVPPAERERVFRRFWRGDRGPAPAGEGGLGGSGLGLAIVARIAAAHGGHVGVDEAPGGGARFTLRLQPPAAAGPAARAGSAEAGLSPRFRPNWPRSGAG